MKLLVILVATIYHVVGLLVVPTMDDSGTCKHPRLVPSHGDSVVVIVEVFPTTWVQLRNPTPLILQFWKARGDTIPIDYSTEFRGYHTLRATCWRKVILNSAVHFNIGCPLTELKTPR